MPTLPAISDIQIFLNSIMAIKIHDPNILVVANKVEHEEGIAMTKDAVKKVGDFIVLPLKKSRALPNTYKEKMSVTEMFKSSKLKAWHYNKVDKQLSDIVKFIQLVKQ